MEWLYQPEATIALALILPLLSIPLLYLLRNYPNRRETATLLVAAFTFVHVLQTLSATVVDNQFLSLTLLSFGPNLSLSFNAEPLGLIFALIASFLWIITTIYAIGYMRGNNESHQTRFYMCFALAIFGALGIAFASNLLTLFLFYELLTLSTYPLVTHQGNDESRKSGRVYLGILMGTSIGLLLPALVWIYTIAGHLNFTIGGLLTQADATSISILLFMVAYGIGKAALMPIHRWLPAAMVAPTPVSALLHAVAVVKAGVFSLVKILIYIFGVDTLASHVEAGGFFAGGWLAYMACLTIILASVVALKQDNLKKRLAYSTISQLSYVILAAALLTPLSILAAAFHIAAHAFGKITLFFAAGAIYTASGKKYVSELDGIGKKMPWTMTAFTIGALSMIGIPPTVGFITKWYLLQGAFMAEHYVAIIVIIASTLLNAAYFLPIIFAAFFKAEAKNKQGKMVKHGEAPFAIVYALLITSLITIWLFIQPELFLQLGLLALQ